MHRPIRTRRLSIAAIASLLLCVAVTGVELRSFWTLDQWNISHGHYVANWEYIALEKGCVLYYKDMSNLNFALNLPFHVSADVSRFHYLGGKLGFDYYNGRNLKGQQKYFMFRIPLWPILLLLLIAPTRWLIARPPNAPAFPAVAKQP